jgi:hypothetical protein
MIKMKTFFVLLILSIRVVLVSAQTVQTITFPEFPVKGYGDATFTLNATASSGLAVTYYSSNTNVATISGSTVTIKTTGYSFISALQSGNGTYATATPVAQLLVVCPKATLAVTANDKTMIVGTAVPTLTYTLTGFKNNQISSVVSGTPVFQALGLNLTEGTYPIVINKGTLSATNYEFQLIDGLLTVNKDTATPIVSATDSTIKIYPNPAKDFVMVENAENDVISIIDFSGKEVYSTKVLNSAARIDVSKLNQGVYILKVNKNHQNYSKTLLINR